MKTYIKLLLPKLSSAHYTIRCMTHYNNIETLTVICRAFSPLSCDARSDLLR